MSPAALAASVLVVSENDASREVAAELVEPFNKVKVKMKMAGAQAPATQCLLRTGPERNGCLAQAGETAFVDAVLLLSAKAAKGRTSVTFSLLSLEDGKLLKREVATGPSANLGQALKSVVGRLAKVVKPRGAAPVAKPEPKPEPKPDPVVVKPEPVRPVETPRVVETPRPDAPAQVNLEPEPPPATAAVANSSGSGLRTVAWMTTGAAIAAAGVASAFGILGLSARGQLDQNDNGLSMLSRSQADALAATANTHFSVALGAAIGAGLFGALSFIFWSQVP